MLQEEAPHWYEHLLLDPDMQVTPHPLGSEIEAVQ